MPAGTTSFYFRTRKALLLGMAARLNELDVADLSRLAELPGETPGAFAGTEGLAQLVMFSAAEPWLTRTKARYEIALHAPRDDDLAAALQQSVDGLYALARQVIIQWHDKHSLPNDGLLDKQTVALCTFINGVMLSFVIGSPAVDDADQLERLIRGVIAGVTQTLPE